MKVADGILGTGRSYRRRTRGQRTHLGNTLWLSRTLAAGMSAKPPPSFQTCSMTVSTSSLMRLRGYVSKQLDKRHRKSAPSGVAQNVERIKHALKAAWLASLHNASEISPEAAHGA